MAWSLPRALLRLRADVAHTQYAAPLRCPCPSVVTVHDVSFARDPGLMSRRDRAVFRRVVPRAVRTAARVLTVSERTKADLVELYDVPEERIVVTPNGVDPAFGPGSGTRDYVLSVGAIQRRKNQLAALDAAQAAGLPLVVVGPTKDPGLEEELRRRGARLKGYVAKERVAELYRGAACLVQSSRFEGFGLPVLEAMASGTPVVAVPDPALREVAETPRSSWRRTRLATGSAKRLPSASGSSRPGSNALAHSAGGRPRSGRSPSTGRYSGREGLRRRRLAQPCRGTHALAAVPRRAGRRNARDRNLPNSVRDVPTGARVLENPRALTFAENVNVGIASTSGEYVLVANPDAIARPDAVATLVAFADAHPRCGIAGRRCAGRTERGSRRAVAFRPCAAPSFGELRCAACPPVRDTA